MICEIIRAPRGGEGVVNLGRYIVGADRDSDPAQWNRLSSYILGEENEKGEIVADVRTTNCVSDEIGLAVKEMAMANSGNITSKASKTYHFVISLAPGETLTPGQFKEAEQRLVDALGFTECKRVSATHCSKDHLHRHVAIATASRPDGRNVRPKHDYAKVANVTAQLEREFGLSVTNHERGTGKGSRGSLLEYAKERATEIGKPESWEKLHEALAEHGLYIKPRGAGLVIGSIEQPKLNVKASDVDSELAFKPLTDRLGEYTLDPVQREGQKHSAEYEAYIEFRRKGRSAQRSKAMALREGQVEHTKALSDFYRNRIDAELKRHMPHQKYARRLNVGIIIEQREAAHRKRREEQRQQQRAMWAETKVPGFEQWKEQKR